MVHRIEPLFSITYRMEHLRVWLTELNFFFDLTQRIEPSVFHDSKNWTLSDTTQGIEHFLNMTQRIEPLSVKHMTQKIFSNMTHRIEPFSWNNDSENCFLMWFKESNTYWMQLKELNTLNSTQRIEPFLHYWKNWTFLFTWLKKLNLLFSVTQRVDFFLECDSKNWTLFLECDSKNWTPFFQYDPKNRTLCWMWLKEIEPFSLKDSKNWLLNLLKIFWLQELKTFLWLGRWNFFFNLNRRI